MNCLTTDEENHDNDGKIKMCWATLLFVKVTNGETILLVVVADNQKALKAILDPSIV